MITICVLLMVALLVFVFMDVFAGGYLIWAFLRGIFRI